MKNLLFFGELPGLLVHGISISNKLNLEMLSERFAIEIIEEHKKLTEHDKITINKLLRLLKNNFSIFYKSLFKRFDYFYLTYSLSSFGSFKSLAAIISFRLVNRGKIVLHLHRGDFFTSFYKSRFNKVVTKLTFGLCNTIIVLSEIQRIDFEKKFRRTFLVLPNTIETEYKNVIKSRKKTNFIYISNYLIDKGIIDLLEVFSDIVKLYPELNLKTFGMFSDSEMEKRVAGYRCANIIVNGPVMGMRKFEEISEAGCLILPSWNEGQPIILLEAMYLGTPVIASGVGLIPQLLGEDYPLLTIPGDRKSLEVKIVQFIKQENLDELSEKLSGIYKSYSHEKHKEKINTIFK